jgi:dienelactone hydrolase
MKIRVCALLAMLVLALLPAACSSKPQATPTASPASEPTEIATQFIQALAKGNYAQATALCDDTMKTAFPPAKMLETWNALVAQMGAFQKLGDTHTQRADPYESVYVTCEFEKGTLDARVVVDRDKRVAGLWFAPHQAAYEYPTPSYAKSGAFQEQELSIGTGDLALPATLSFPVGSGPFPAVVLVHGSGPNDRDETLEGNKPFRDLAWGLASQGVAVLRYEKRTKAHPEQFVAMQSTLTVKEETVDDAVAAAALLRSTPGIDAKRVFVLGHSLGGTLAPRIAKADAQVAGLVILAGATLPLEDLMVSQTTYIASLDGAVSADEQKNLDEIKRQVERVKDPNLTAASEPQGLLGAPVSYWLDLRSYKPAQVAAELMVPMLILQGARDYQVGSADFEGWKAALSAHSNVEFKLYPDLNHLFISGEGKSSPTEYQTPGHVAEAVISDIAAWIKRH